MLGRKLTDEELLWLALADAEKDLKEATEKLFDVTMEFRKYKLSKGDKPKLI